MKRVLILIFILMFSINLFSQESSIYIGGKSMREVNVSYDYSLGYNKKVGATIGYIFANGYERPYGNIYDNFPALLTRKQNQQGLSLSPFIKFVKGKRRRLLLALSFEYQYLKSGNYINHTTSQSGSTASFNSGEYSEFKHTYNNFAFLFGIHHEFLPHNIGDIYFECGMAYKHIKRIYSIDGTYYQRSPSDRIEYIGNLTPTFRIGLNFRILSFGEKLENPIIKERRKAIKQRNSDAEIRML